MATVKQYGYYIEGNKISVVQKDTSFDNDVNSKDYGPGSDKIQWKSPLETVTDGLEIQYIYTPSYRINDLTATVTCEGYQEKASTGLLQLVDGGTSMPTSGITHVVIRGHAKWNGLHKINEFTSSSLLTLETKYNVVDGSITNESYTLYTDVDVLNDEDDVIDVSPYLSKALVWYVKARFLEDAGDIEKHEYYMRKFKKMIEKHENSRVAGPRVIAPNSHFST
tara:strand:+ start:826 stop:1494 length:669 start_codon:yes stop_codon:yes gene_type:complete